MKACVHCQILSKTLTEPNLTQQILLRILIQSDWRMERDVSFRRPVVDDLRAQQKIALPKVFGSCPSPSLTCRSLWKQELP